MAAYASSKGALNALARSMAIDEAAHGVRVNAVCPGSVDTPMLRRSAALFSDGSPEGIERTVAEWGRSTRSAGWRGPARWLRWSASWPAPGQLRHRRGRQGRRRAAGRGGGGAARRGGRPRGRHRVRTSWRSGWGSAYPWVTSRSSTRPSSRSPGSWASAASSCMPPLTCPESTGTGPRPSCGRCENAARRPGWPWTAWRTCPRRTSRRSSAARAAATSRSRTTRRRSATWPPPGSSCWATTSCRPTCGAPTWTAPGGAAPGHRV